MAPRSLAHRFLAVAGMAVWLGGFTFYGAVVVPILHDELDRLQAGGITRRATDALNVIGAATLAAWWWNALAERSLGPARVRRARAALLAVSTALLAGLFALHAVMDRRLDSVGLRGFYPLHRAYLLASTAQWLVNLATLGTSLVLWGPAPVGRGHLPAGGSERDNTTRPSPLRPQRIDP